MPRVLKTPAAEEDLISIGTYIALDNPSAADKLLDTIDKKLHLLAEFPGLGQRRDELAPSLRSLPLGNYLIFYLAIEDGIEAIRIVHGARNLRSIFRRGKA
jgi:toxin ParE1/3/4